MSENMKQWMLKAQPVEETSHLTTWESKILRERVKQEDHHQQQKKKFLVWSFLYSGTKFPHILFFSILCTSLYGWEDKRIDVIFPENPQARNLFAFELKDPNKSNNMNICGLEEWNNNKNERNVKNNLLKGYNIIIEFEETLEADTVFFLLDREIDQKYNARHRGPQVDPILSEEFASNFYQHPEHMELNVAKTTNKK